MKSILLMIASLAGSSAQAAIIGITYNFAGSLTGPPVLSGTTLTLDGLDTGSILSGNSSLNSLWNPVTVRDHSMADITTGLLNGLFTITFANGDILSGDLSEDVSSVLANNSGPFTQTFTFTGGTGKFVGASGSISGAGVVDLSGGFISSGRGTLAAPGISSTPEPASVVLAVGGLLCLAVKRKRSASLPLL